MELVFKQILSLIQDVRLNPLNEEDIKDYKLRKAEDLCITAIKFINEERRGNN